MPPARLAPTISSEATPASPPVEDGERRILEAIGARQAERAVELLAADYGELVYRYCRRMVGDDADADDVSQHVFLQAFEGIRAGTEVATARGWLLGIARHRCLDRLKARRRAPVPMDPSAIDRAADDEPVHAMDLLDPRALSGLDECLDALDARSRAVVVLHFHDQLSYEEISRITGDRPGALRVRVTRALPALRSCLTKKGVSL